MLISLPLDMSHVGPLYSLDFNGTAVSVRSLGSEGRSTSKVHVWGVMKGCNRHFGPGYQANARDGSYAFGLGRKPSREASISERVIS